MSFNLYYAGAQCAEVEDWLVANKCHKLYSQLTERRAIKRWLDRNPTSNLFIDSGAYSAHSRGVELDVDEYIDYLNDLDDLVTIFAQVDKIPGTLGKARTLDDIEEAPALSWDNYLYMRTKLKSPDKCLPIFHQGENIKWLDNMLEATFDGEHIPYIGISPCNDLNVHQKEIYISECFKHIKNSSNPNVKVHAFGMTSLKVLERYPLYSADSTSWVLIAAMGSVMTPWGTYYVGDRLKSSKNLNYFSDDVKDKVNEYFVSIGSSLQDVSENYVSRLLANCKFTHNWALNYQYRPMGVSKKKLI